MDTVHFTNGSSITPIEAEPSVRSKGHAAWIRLGDVGFLEHEWQCSACLDSWSVKGIMTPKGLGYKECPNCHANMTEVIQ